MQQSVLQLCLATNLGAISRSFFARCWGLPLVTSVQISFLRQCGSTHPSATAPHGSATPHFVIPSEAEGSAVRLHAETKALQVSSQVLTKRFLPCSVNNPACRSEAQIAERRLVFLP